jgi:hypothetical protein
MLSLNCNVQPVKIYLPCNFEVNPITHFRVKVLKFWKFEEKKEKKKKKANNSKIGNGIYFKIAG